MFFLRTPFSLAGDRRNNLGPPDLQLMKMVFHMSLKEVKKGLD